MPRPPSKISRAATGSRKAAAIDDPQAWPMHQAVLASCLAISSTTGTYCAGDSSAPPSERGNSKPKSPRSASAATIASGSSRPASIASPARSRREPRSRAIATKSGGARRASSGAAGVVVMAVSHGIPRQILTQFVARERAAGQPPPVPPGLPPSVAAKRSAMPQIGIARTQAMVWTARRPREGAAGGGGEMASDEMANAAQREYWNRVAGPRWVGLEGFVERRVQPVNDLLLRRSAAASGERVLEVGCGTGAATVPLAKAVGAKGEVAGRRHLEADAGSGARAHRAKRAQECDVRRDRRADPLVRARPFRSRRIAFRRHVLRRSEGGFREFAARRTARRKALFCLLGVRLPTIHIG